MFPFKSESLVATKENKTLENQTVVVIHKMHLLKIEELSHPDRWLSLPAGTLHTGHCAESTQSQFMAKSGFTGRLFVLKTMEVQSLFRCF